MVSSTKAILATMLMNITAKQKLEAPELSPKVLPKENADFSVEDLLEKCMIRKDERSHTPG